MYNTVRECHIAIDTGLQQVNSNRKQAFRPEQYDILLTNETLNYINSKIDPKDNVKLEGFEDIQRRYDELKDLKNTTSLKFYNYNSSYKYTIIPTDYYRLIAGGCIVTSHYNKRQLTITPSTETKYIYVIEIPDDTPSAQGVQVYKNFNITSTTFFNKSYTKHFYNKDSKFEIINYYLDYFNKELRYNAYWEYYNGGYNKNRLILIPPTRITNPITLTFITGTDGISTVTKTSTETIESLIYNTTTGNTITSAIEIISSKNKAEAERNYYINKNRFDQPLCYIEKDKFYIKYDITFVPLRIDFNYIIKPRQFNYYDNIMPEFQINDEIIGRVVDKLKVFIKDDQMYNAFLNSMNKIQ